MIGLGRFLTGIVLSFAMVVPSTGRELRLVHDIASNHPRIRYIDAMIAAASSNSALLTVEANPDGIIYPGYAGVEALESGHADLALVNASNLERIDPRMGFVNLPFTMNDGLMTDSAVRDGVILQLDLIAQEKGWRVLGLMRGADQLFAFAEPIAVEPSAFEGLTIRVAGPGIYEKLLRGFGATPVVMPFPKLKEAFAEHRVQGVFTSPGGWASQLGMEATHALQVPGLMMITYAVILRSELFDRLDEAERLALMSAAKGQVTDAWDEMLKDDAVVTAGMKKQGAHVVTVEAIEAWRQPTRVIHAEFASDYPDVWSDLQFLLTEGSN